MAVFAYKGVGPGGKAVTGNRDAESPKALRQLLRREGVIVTSAEPAKGSAGKKAANAKQGLLSKDVDLGGLIGGVKQVEIATFTRKLATLLKAGIPLAESLNSLVGQTLNPRFQTPLSEVRTDVNEGRALADAMAKHPKLFNELFVSMVRAGETAGNLDAVLSRLADFLEASQKLKSKVQSAMMYPIIMMIVGGGIMVVLMVAVVPKITEMVSSQGKVLPINTRMLIWTSEFLSNHLGKVLLAIVAGIYGYRRWKATPEGRLTWDRFVLKLPRIGQLVRAVNVGRFSRTLGTMLSSGVPMLRSLETAKMIMGNVVMRSAIDEAKKAVTEGESLAGTLKKSGQFPLDLTDMVAVGERAGQLEAMLGRVADTYDSEVDTALGRFTGMLEPLMLVVMGGSVMFIVFSLLQPIMSLGELTPPRK